MSFMVPPNSNHPIVLSLPYRDCLTGPASAKFALAAEGAQPDHNAQQWHWSPASLPARGWCIAGRLLCICLYWTARYQFWDISQQLSFILHSAHVLWSSCSPLWSVFNSAFYKYDHCSINLWLMKILTRTCPRTDLAGPHWPQLPGWQHLSSPTLSL